MNHIEICIENWHRIDDKEVLRVVKAAIQSAIKYDSERTLDTWHYYHDPDKHVELHMRFK